MVEVNVIYEGDLHCRAIHGPSGGEFPTDAPLDNRGKGEAFSPTDLVGTALGTCILTVVGIKARDKNIDMTGATARVLKEMNKPGDGHRRIARLDVEIRLPLPPDLPERALLENTAHHCPVHHSLHPDVQVNIEIFWEG